VNQQPILLSLNQEVLVMLRLTLSLAVILLAAGASAAGELKSGPQVGEGRRGYRAAFLNGMHAGKSYCPV
jgi:hypothetical protein